jgi:dipeptidyl aminopeptidase/acylaminoacyl peptidase
MLPTPDFLSWCGNRLVVAAGGDRYATDAKQLRLITPRWRTTNLTHDASSWVSPACSPNGRVVAASRGRSWVEPRFGLERRSIWLLRVDGSGRKRLTSPPSLRTDESPHWSADGRFVLFVRAGPTARGATAPGALWLIRIADGRLFGPLVNAGRVSNYYGHYGWTDAVDWYAPRR